MKRCILILCPLILTIGCQDNSTAIQTTQSITADDLAHADGLCWWIVEVPAVPEDQVLCLAFVDQKGTIESRGCPGVKSGDRVKVVVSGLSDSNLRYSLVTPKDAYRSTVINYFNYINGPTTQHLENAKIGDFLMKKSNTKRCSGTDSPLEETEIGLKLIFEKDAQPWKREDYHPFENNS